MRKWRTYEEVAAYLLDQFAQEFGLERVEEKQLVRGKRSGTTWEIDAKGVREGNTGFVIVECRRYTTSRLNQEAVGGLAYRIIDTGAEGGILVTPLDVQVGAKKIASAEGIVTVQLNADSSPHQYLLRFLDKVMVGLQDHIRITPREEIRVELYPGSKTSRGQDKST